MAVTRIHFILCLSPLAAPGFPSLCRNLYLKQWWRGLTHSKGGHDYYCSKCSQINLLDLFFQLFFNILSRLEKENLLEYKRKAVRLAIYDRGLWVKTCSLFSLVSHHAFQVLTRYKNHIATCNRTWSIKKITSGECWRFLVDSSRSEKHHRGVFE